MMEMKAQEIFKEAHEEIQEVVKDVKGEVKEQVEEVVEDAKKTSIVDAILNKFISRKLIVWGASTAFLYFDKITGDQWIAIGLAYIGIQGVADIAAKYMESRK